VHKACQKIFLGKKSFYYSHITNLKTTVIPAQSTVIPAQSTVIPDLILDLSFVPEMLNQVQHDRLLLGHPGLDPGSSFFA